MAETTNEQLNTEDLKRREEEWKDFYRQQGAPITPSISQHIMQAIFSGLRPPQPEGRVSSETEEKLKSGKSIVDYLPQEHQETPDVPVRRSLTELEKNMQTINEQLKLKDYPPPPGKVVDMKRLNWAEYGWDDEGKREVIDLLTKKLGIRGEKQKRALEALVLEGYTSEEVLERLRAEDPRQEEGNMGFFARLFDVPKSSLRLVFSEELKESQSFISEPQDMEEFAWQLSWTGDVGGMSGEWMQHSDHPIFEARAEEVVDNKGKRRLRGKYYINETNFMLWFRKQTDILYDIHGPNGPISCFGHNFPFPFS